MNAAPLRLALGLGCDRGTPAATIAEAVDQALTEVAARFPGATLVVSAAGSIDLKADEAGLLELTTSRGWPLFFYPAARLATVPVPNPSATVLRHTGTPSVSAAAALLAAGNIPQIRCAVERGAAADRHAPAPMAQLLIEKFRLRGPDGRNATVSIARIAP